ncbi:MAG: dUTP diphosphatase, partial [Clostridiales bacterium]
GFDFYAAIEEPVLIESGCRVMIPTGIKFAIPSGLEMQVRPRSGLAAKNGVTVLNTPGTIDSDYRGEVKVILINLGDTAFTVERGMRIAQGIVAPYVKADFKLVSALDETSRGSGGFGHTGA